MIRRLGRGYQTLEAHYTAVAAVATALCAVTHRRRSCKNGSQSRGYKAAFTLAELLVTVGVLVLLVLLFTQLLNSVASITTLGHKQMDADSQARQLLDRMAIDVAQMVKRRDVDYYLKSSANPQTGGNDQVAFYSAVPGYYPTTGSPSPVSLVAYRVNSDSTSSSYNKMERMGKGLLWNGSGTATPVLFLPIPLATASPFATPTPAWPQAGNMTADPDYEVIGPQVFRFEYYYLLRNGAFSTTPKLTAWDPALTAGGNVVGMQDVAAVVVDIAAIDPKSKVLLNNAQIASLAGQLGDYTSGMVPGQLRNNWQNTLNANTTLPRPAVSGIRLYERYFYLSQ